MGLWEEGIRGRVIEAIGGWQWGRGSRPRVYGGRFFAGTTEGGMGMIEEDGSSRRRDSSTSLRSARNDMWSGEN